MSAKKTDPSAPTEDIDSARRDALKAFRAEGEKRLNIQLLKAAATPLPMVVKYYLDHGADPNYQDDEGMAALHHAASKGSWPCIRLLVESERCDFSIRDSLGRYASDIAIEWSRDYDMALMLTEKRMAQRRSQ